MPTTVEIIYINIIYLHKNNYIANVSG